MDFLRESAELQEETVENRRISYIKMPKWGWSCQEQRSTSWRN